MAHTQNLHRRGKSGIYYARIFVPLDLQAVMGKKEMRPSLHTTELAEAKRRLNALLDKYGAIFDKLRRRQTLTDDDIQTAVWDHYHAGLTAGDAERLARPTKEDIDRAEDEAIAAGIASGAFERGFIATVNAMADVELLAGKAESAARRRAIRLNQLKLDLASGDTRLIERDADAFIAKHRFKVDRAHPRYRELCHKLMRAEVEQLAQYAERDAGNFGSKPKDEIIREPTVRTDALVAAKDTIMALFASYERENPNDIRPESMKQARRDVQNFADFVGRRSLARRITRAQVRDWKAMLAEYPVKATETAAFKGLSPGDIVVANKALATPKPPLTTQTLRRYMGSLSGFCAWLVTNDYLESNPVAGMLPKKRGPTYKRHSFTDDALETLFSSPLFATAKGDHWRDLDKPGNVAVRDHRYWIPWVMLYSGARSAEIAQLLVADVRLEQGVWIMHVVDDDGTGKRTKTGGSRRIVPVTPLLLTWGS